MSIYMGLYKNVCLVKNEKMKESLFAQKVELWSRPEVGLLKEVFKEEGIRAVLFDLDDTLMRTYFREGRLVFMRALEKTIGREIEEKDFMAEWYELFKLKKAGYGVSPNTFLGISQEMTRKHGGDVDDPLLATAFDEMIEVIYETVPENIPGAFEAVQIIKAAGVDVGIGTHAEYDWTWKKLKNWRGEFRAVHCIDVYGPKDARGWLELMNIMGVDPTQVAMVGDNIEADIIPGQELGVKHLFRVASSWGKAKNLPEGVHEVENLEEIIEIFLR